VVGDGLRRRGRVAAALVAAALVACAAPPAVAYTLLPLTTEEARTLPSGTAEAVLGVAYFHNGRFPPFTPPGALRSQELVAAPQFRFHIAAGSWAEIQASYETLYLDEESTGGQHNWQFGSGDMRIFTKVHIINEREFFPGIGLRFGTKLPNANRRDRLGTDDTDFGADALVSKDLGPLSAHLNLGLLLLGNSGPLIGNSFRAGGQDDMVDYAVGVESAPLTGSAATTVVRLLAEIAGQGNSHFNNDRSVARVGLQAQRGRLTFYAAVDAGLVTGSEDVGANAGVVYTFRPAELLHADDLP